MQPKNKSKKSLANSAKNCYLYSLAPGDYFEVVGLEKHFKNLKMLRKCLSSIRVSGYENNGTEKNVSWSHISTYMALTTLVRKIDKI